MCSSLLALMFFCCLLARCTRRRRTSSTIFSGGKVHNNQRQRQKRCFASWWTAPLSFESNAKQFVWGETAINKADLRENRDGLYCQIFTQMEDPSLKSSINIGTVAHLAIQPKNDFPRMRRSGFSLRSAQALLIWATTRFLERLGLMGLWSAGPELPLCLSVFV